MRIPLAVFFLVLLLPSQLIAAPGDAPSPLHPGEKVPADTISPNGRYGVTVPHVDIDDDKSFCQYNRIIDLQTSRILGTIHASTGFDRSLNHHEMGVARWSKDSSLLVWEVGGKWFPDALVVVRIKNGKMMWQTDLLKTTQQAILTRTRKAAPADYAAARVPDTGEPSAYPDGFTVNMHALDPVALPLQVRVSLTANVKDIPDDPNVESHLDGFVDEDGDFHVTQFALGMRESEKESWMSEARRKYPGK